jgi:gamma-glutamylputrescine oxidase
MALTPGIRFWSQRTADNRRRVYPRLRGKHTIDVVIIGGGLTGTATAYALAHAGAKVMLLESDRLASGTTGGSLGVIAPEPDADLVSVDEMRGRKVARPAWNEARKAAVDFAAVLKRLKIKCDLAPTDYVINACDAAAASALKREQVARRAARLAAPWLSGVVTRRDLSTDSEGSIRLSGASIFDPVRAALGLANAAEAKGAKIFEHSRVMKTTFTRKYADVILDGQTRVRTTGIIVATGGPGALFGQLRRHVRGQDGYVVVTEPLTRAMQGAVGRRASVVAERGESPRFLRWLSDNRVLFAGASQPVVAPRNRDKALIQRTGQLMYELSVRYPAISGIPPAFSWDMPIVTTMDGLPWIGAHRNYPFHFFAMALGWHGDAIAWHAARAAVRHFTSEPKKEDDTFGFLRAL